MRKALSIALLAAVAFTACSKDDKDPSNGNSCDTGDIQFLNNSNNPYSVYVDNKFIRSQAGKSSFEYSFDKGFHKVTVEQESGYLFTPTIRNYELTLKGCDEKIVSYP